MKLFTDFYTAWNFLYNHRIFQYKGESYFTLCLDIFVVKINPKTEKIDKDDLKNTAVRIWLECGPWIKPGRIEPRWMKKNYPFGMESHDIELDCGAPTFEEAIVKLANLVAKKHGSKGKERKNHEKKQ